MPNNLCLATIIIRVLMLTTNPSMLPIMLPSSKVASLDRVFSITCTIIKLITMPIQVAVWLQQEIYPMEQLGASFSALPSLESLVIVIIIVIIIIIIAHSMIRHNLKQFFS